MDAKRRREVETQLRAAGYAIPETMRFTQGKVTMYRHKPLLNVEGQVVKPCGDVVPNQPVHPDHKARLVARGLRDWPFRGVCVCNPCVCRERMSAEDFDRAMRSRGLDPEKVMPKGVIQAVNAADVKPDTRPVDIVAGADVANAELAERQGQAEKAPPEAAHVKTGDGECACGWKSVASARKSRQISLDRHIDSQRRQVAAVA